MSTTLLPNKNVGVPAVGDPGWGVTVGDGSLTNIDAAFGGNQAFNLGAASGTVNVNATAYNGAYPANVASYIPLSWTLTGTLTHDVTLTIPSGAGGQWIVNNQCVMGSHTITFAAAGGSTSAPLTTGIQSFYSDGLGHINITNGASPFVVVDDGTARIALDNVSSTPTLAVGPTKTAVGSLTPAIQATTTGVVSFPAGVTTPADWQKNRLDNSSFYIWQTGTTFSIAASSFLNTADRWFSANNTSVLLTVLKTSAQFGEAGGVGYNGIDLRATGVAPSEYVSLVQRFEAQRMTDLAGGTATLSFRLVGSTSAGSLLGTVQIYTNTSVDDGTYANVNPSVNFTVTGSDQTVKVLLGPSQMANVDQGGEIFINFIQLAATGNIDISFATPVLEKGAVANAYSPPQLSAEFAECQRYLSCSWPNLTAPATGFGPIFATAGSIINTSFVPATVMFPSQMRVTPTVTVYDTGGNPGRVTVAGVVNQVASAGGVSTVMFDAINNNSGVTWSPGSNVNFRWMADARL